MSRKSVQDERRLQIMEALHKCLLEKPFDKTSIKDIAAEAGINHGMLHYYYKSKDDILLNYIEYIIDMYRTMFNEWLAKNGGSFSSTQAFLRGCFDFMHERITLNRDISRIFVEIWEISNYNDKVKSKLKNAYTLWINTVADLVSDQLEDRETALLVSTAVVAFLEGLSLFSVMFEKDEFPLENLLDKFRHLLLNKLLI